MFNIFNIGSVCSERLEGDFSFSLFPGSGFELPHVVLSIPIKSTVFGSVYEGTLRRMYPESQNRHMEIRTSVVRASRSESEKVYLHLKV